MKEYEVQLVPACRKNPVDESGRHVQPQYSRTTEGVLE